MDDAMCNDALIVQKGRNNSIAGLGNTAEQLDFTAAYYYLGIAISVVCLVVWVGNKYRYERTRVRPTIFLVLGIASSLSTQSCGPLQIMAKESYPCWLGVILLLMIVPFATASIILRYMLFSFLTRFAQGATRVQSKLEQDTVMSIASASSSPRDRIRSGCRRARNLAALLFSGDREIQSEAELYDLRFLTSPKGVFSLVFVFVVPVLVFALIILATDPVLTRCYNCAYSDTTQFVLMGICSVYAVVSLVFWYSARKTRAEDKWGIKSECFWSLVAIVIAFIGFVLSIVEKNHKALSPYAHQFMLVSGLWLLVIQQSVVQIFLAWRAERQMNEFKKDGMRNANASSTARQAGEDLDDILKDTVLADLFEKHLVAEFGVESLFFLRQGQEWKRVYFDISPSSRVARARKIYASYVSLNGLYAVNVPAEIHDTIETALMTEPIPEDCTREVFDEAMNEIRHLLTTGAVLRFNAAMMRYRRGQEGNLKVVALSTGIV